MPYLFCLIVDVATLACIAFLGWLIWKGASMWFVLVIILLTFMPVFPGRDIFTCQRCGNIAEVKLYKGRMNRTVGVQKDKDEPDD